MMEDPFLKSSLYADFCTDLKNALDASSVLSRSSRRSSKSRRSIVGFLQCMRDSNVEEDSKLIMLAMYNIRQCGGDEKRIKDSFIPDQDRVIMNEAIYAKLHVKYIKVLLQLHNKACESGGIVDHVDHPIHLACIRHPYAVRTILDANPDCARQRNQDNKLPLDLFFEKRGFQIPKDISKKDFIATVNHLSQLNEVGANSFFARTKPQTPLASGCGKQEEPQIGLERVEHSSLTCATKNNSDDEEGDGESVDKTHRNNSELIEFDI